MNRKRKITIMIALLLVVAVTASINIIKYKSDSTDIFVKVPDYYALAQFNFNGDINKFRRDCYEWYKSIEGNEGVYIVNTAYYDDELLQTWKENKIYNITPADSFWYFTVSPTYLSKMGISLEQKYMDAAVKGVRLYMIPDTLNNSEREKMAAYLKEDAVKEVQTSSIKTEFTENQQVQIITYTPNDTTHNFTWPSDKGQPTTETAPVIYVCTAENMKYFENESLISTGVDSYIKFENSSIMSTYAQKGNMMQLYNLQFTSSSEIYENAAKNGLVSSKIAKLFDEQ